jgi:hypothetical protein
LSPASTPPVGRHHRGRDGPLAVASGAGKYSSHLGLLTAALFLIPSCPGPAQWRCEAVRAAAAVLHSKARAAQPTTTVPVPDPVAVASSAVRNLHPVARPAATTMPRHCGPVMAASGAAKSSSHSAVLMLGQHKLSLLHTRQLHVASTLHLSFIYTRRFHAESHVYAASKCHD